jgi:hypothetical protein
MDSSQFQFVDKSVTDIPEKMRPSLTYWQDAWRRGAAKGDFISNADNEQLSRVCVIGTTTAKDLFGKTSEFLRNNNLQILEMS